MGRTIFSCSGGRVALPDEGAALIGREDGGNLIVTPPHEVWERAELTPGELTRWSFLVAAAGRAMLDVLPQLAGGCVNYWEAGNWALNEEAEPRGPKTATGHRKVHTHLLGRSRAARHPSWRWGEAPKFPDFAERRAWAAGFERLTADECREIVARVESILTKVYGMGADQISPWAPCPACGYPSPVARAGTPETCPECRAGS